MMHDYEFIDNDHDIYVSIDFLNRMLPQAQFVVDRAAQKILISGSNCGTLSEWCETIPVETEIAPTPLASPVEPVTAQNMSVPAPSVPQLPYTPVEEPVIVDDQNHVTPIPGQPPISLILGGGREAPDVIHTTRSEENPPAEPEKIANESNGSDIDTLILQPRIKNLAPNNEYIEALDIGGHIFLPLNDFVQLFGFPIKIDKDISVAEGFFFSSDNKFVLNVGKRTVTVSDRNYDLTPQNVRKYNGNIYVSTDAISDWFGIQSDLIRKDSVIHFTTARILPEEERMERQARWDKLLAGTNSIDKDSPVIQNPYKAFGYPIVDVNITSTYNHAQSSNSSAWGGPRELDRNWANLRESPAG